MTSPIATDPTASPSQTSDWMRKAQQSWRSMISWTSTAVPTNNQPPSTTRKVSVLTVQNQRQNDPWGDIMQEKPTNCTRIHVQNVNGFTLDNRGGQFDTFCSIHKEIQADISCGQEHKLDTTQGTSRAPERTIPTINNKGRRNNGLHLDMPSDQDRGVDFLLRLLPHQCQVPPRVLLHVPNPVGHDRTKRNVYNRTSLRFQPTYHERNSLRPPRLRRCKLPIPVDPTRYRSSNPFHASMAEKYTRWKVIPHSSILVSSPSRCVLSHTGIPRPITPPTQIQMDGIYALVPS